MPARNLYLLGFTTRMWAINFLRQLACVPDVSSGGLRQLWQTAKDRRGDRTPNAGYPQSEPIVGCDDYLDRVVANPRFVAWRRDTLFDGMPFEFRTIEIDPLIAFQPNVDLEKVDLLARSVICPPTLDEKLQLNLPVQNETIAIEVPPGRQKPGTIVLRSENMNLTIEAAGYFGVANQGELHVGGVGLVARPGVVQVIEYDGRCYLRNGYHRAYVLRTAGATDMPCLFLKASRWEQVGVEAAKSPFDPALLQSDDAPTMAHFSQGRAIELLVRRASRVVTMTYKTDVEFEP